MITRPVAFRIVVALFALGVARAQAMTATIQDGTIAGRIFDGATNVGIRGMTVKLTPPKATPRPKLVTQTNDQGVFDFGKPEKGRYLLEVYQGGTLLYRRVIDSSRNSEFEVRLRQRGR